MKRFLIMVLMLFLALPAHAEMESAVLMAAHSDEVCAYIGPENLIYQVGVNEPLVEEKASELLYASDTQLIYLTAEESNADLDRERTLVSLDLAAEPHERAEISGGVRIALWSGQDQALYYVTHAQPNSLARYEPDLGGAGALCDAPETIARLRLGTDGLLVEAGERELLYIPALNALAPPPFDARGMTVAAGDRFDALLDAGGNLSLRVRGAAAAQPVDTDVLSMCVENGIIYYLTGGSPAEFRAYTAQVDHIAGMYTFGEKMTAQLALDGGSAFMLGESGVLYRYQLTAGECAPIGMIASSVRSPMLLAFDGQVLVYDGMAEAGERFVTAIEAEAAPIEPEEPVPTPSARPVPTARPAPTKEPAPQYETLSNGSRGDAVVALQKKLKALGYLSGSADGVYGSATVSAVTYLQGDMGLSETGKADAKFQRSVLEGKPPHYEPCVALGKGDEGIRVRDLQARLRTLCYMTANAGGHYQTNTVQAVKRFQKQLGYKQTGNITVKQLEKLFSKSCPECAEYFALEKGDDAPAVKRLNQRLKKLKYFKGTASSSFGKATVQAIERFQMTNGLLATGACDANLQYMIFSPKCKPYVDPDVTPEPTKKPQSGQVITDKQVKVIANFLNKYYGEHWGAKKAVTRLQNRLVDFQFMTSSEVNGVYDAVTKDAVRRYQHIVLGWDTQSGVADKPTLRAMFD